MIELYNVCWLLLAQGPKGVAEAGDAASQSARSAPGFFEGWGVLFPAMLAFMLVYLLLVRPQSPTAKSSEMLSKLKKNDRVITAGGILGTVVSYGTGDEFVTLRIDDNSNARMQILATSIVRVVSEKEAKAS